MAPSSSSRRSSTVGMKGMAVACPPAAWGAMVMLVGGDRPRKSPTWDASKLMVRSRLGLTWGMM